MQGNPDPYSAFGQGLTGGINAGVNIMQMIQQKAQATRDNDMKALKTWADMASDLNLPEAMVEDAYNRLAKPALLRLDPKTPIPENMELGDRKIGKKIKGIIEGPYDDEFKQKAIQQLLITAPEKVQATFKPYMDTLKEGITVQKRKAVWEGTPATSGLAAPSIGYNPNTVDTTGTMYGLTGDIPGTPGTPGVGASFEGLRGTDPMRHEIIKQNYLDTGKFSSGDLSKDEKAQRMTTIKLNVGPDGKSTPGKIHEWGYDPYTQTVGKYIGEATPAGVSGGGYGTVVIPTDTGFQVVDKTAGTAIPVKTSAGEPVKKPLTGEMITTQQQIGTIKDVFDRMAKLYKPEYVGPVQGRAGGARSVTIGNPKERATFYSTLQDVNNTLVYLKSGKQINEQEYERLKGAMPHKDLADSDFEARVEEFNKVVASIVEERQKAMGGYGGGKPKASDFWK